MSQEIRPSPLTPVYGDLRHLQSTMIPICYKREMWVKLTPEDYVACDRLISASWGELPAGSLPTDDRMLAEFAGMSGAQKVWAKRRSVLLADWIECSDGRLYNPRIAEEITKIVAKSIASSFRRWCDRMRKPPNLPSPRHRFVQPKQEEWFAAGRPEHWPDGYVLEESSVFSGGKTSHSSGHLSNSNGIFADSTGIPADSGLNRKEKKRKEISLSGAYAADDPSRIEDALNEHARSAIHQRLLEVGWSGRADQAQAIEGCVLALPSGALEEVLSNRAKCNSWPEATSWILSCLNRKLDEQESLATGNETPGRKNSISVLAELDKHHELVVEQAQARQKFGRAFLELPCDRRIALQAEFVASSCEAKKAADPGWKVDSDRLWRLFKGWLYKTNPELHDQLVESAKTGSEETFQYGSIFSDIQTEPAQSHQKTADNQRVTQGDGAI